MPKQLKEESYYSDRYDLLTIEECFRISESWRKASLQKSSDEYVDKLSDKERLKVFSFASNFNLYWVKGERYRRKATIIQEWMNRDRKRDDLFQSTQEPSNIRCPNCSLRMSVILKELYELGGESARVLFFFECPACKKRKGYFDNSEEFRSKPELCPKCNKAIQVSYIDRGEVMVWSRKCSACGFTEKETDDFNKMRTERIDRENREEELLKKHRADFCLSTAEGQEYFESISQFEMLRNLVEKAELRQKDPDYKKAESLKKWSIVELEKTLSVALEKEQYAKLTFDRPEIDKYVIVPFTAQDATTSREEKDSIYGLRKIMKKALDGSNWRLMSEGVSYRLGYLSGRLKGYEREEDLVRIIKQEKPTAEEGR